MKTEAMTMPASREEGFEPYRAVSRAAVISLVLAVLSLLGFISAAFVPLALVGAVLGLVSYRSIRRYPNELTGKPLALVGLVLGAVCFVAATSRHAYIYATEVPEGHRRISFAELQPDKGRPYEPVPSSAMQLNGEKVFVKGYLYPDGQQTNIKRFVLVPDMGTCCFGGQPKLTDMIEVTLEDPLRAEYSLRKRKLAGVLKVDTQLKPVTGLNGVYYQLEADFLR